MHPAQERYESWGAYNMQKATAVPPEAGACDGIESSAPQSAWEVDTAGTPPTHNNGRKCNHGGNWGLARRLRARRTGMICRPRSRGMARHGRSKTHVGCKASGKSRVQQ